MALLEVKNLTVRYGPVVAVQDLSLAVDEGGTVLLTGPNGSGKTSVLLSVMGVVRPQSGAIRFRGEDISHLKPWERVSRGIGILPENRRLFDDLTVEENLRVVCDLQGADGSASLINAYGVFPVLQDRRSLPSRLLSGGERQMLALARLLVQRPLLALLDDPLAGIAEGLAIAFVCRAKWGAPSRLIAVPEGGPLENDASQVISLRR